MKTVASEVAAEIPKNYLRLCPRCRTAGQSVGMHDNEVPALQGAPRTRQRCFVSVCLPCFHLCLRVLFSHREQPLFSKL